MAIHELAGKSALKSMLINVPELVSAYYDNRPQGPFSFVMGSDLLLTLINSFKGKE